MTDYDLPRPDDEDTADLIPPPRADDTPLPGVTRPLHVQTDDPADTRPKPPPGLREAVGLEDTAEIRVQRTRARPMLLLTIMLSTLCICLTLVGMAGVAGYRDGLATSHAKSTQAQATEIADQYALAMDDLQQGRYELAIARLSWIVQTVQPGREYMQDSPELLALASTMNAASDTPMPTTTFTPSPSPSPTTSAPVEISPTPGATDPDTLYNQAAGAMARQDYEEAILWLDSLRAAAPDHRPQETQAMLMEALVTLGKTYIYGANADGEDKLARGIFLLYRANEIEPVEPQSLMYEADFAERYLNARNYLIGGNTAAALPVLTALCNENCNWGYHGVSVRDLLIQAGGSPP